MTVLEFVAEIFCSGIPPQQKIKPPKVLLIFNLLTVAAVIWLPFELKTIALMKSPFLFSVIAAGAGLSISFFIMYLLWRMIWVEFLTRQIILAVSIPVILFTICCASRIIDNKKKQNLNFKLTHHAKLLLSQ